MRTSRAFLMVIAALGLVFAGVRGLPTWLMVGRCASSWVCDVINMVITSCFLALQHCAFCFASISSSLRAAWAVVRMVPACPRRLGLCLLPHSTPLLGRVPALAVAFNHIIISCKTWLAARCCSCDATLALFCDRVVVSCAMWVAAGNCGCGVDALLRVPLPPHLRCVPTAPARPCPLHATEYTPASPLLRPSRPGATSTCCARSQWVVCSGAFPHRGVF